MELMVELLSRVSKVNNYIVSYQYIIHIHYYSQCESPLGKRTTIPILWKVSKTTNYKYGYQHIIYIDYGPQY